MKLKYKHNNAAYIMIYMHTLDMVIGPYKPTYNSGLEKTSQWQLRDEVMLYLVTGFAIFTVIWSKLGLTCQSSQYALKFIWKKPCYICPVTVHIMRFVLCIFKVTSDMGSYGVWTEQRKKWRVNGDRAETGEDSRQRRYTHFSVL